MLMYAFLRDGGMPELGYTAGPCHGTSGVSCLCLGVVTSKENPPRACPVVRDDMHDDGTAAFWFTDTENMKKSHPSQQTGHRIRLTYYWI